jgi:hypothetical protein
MLVIITMCIPKKGEKCVVKSTPSTGKCLLYGSHCARHGGQSSTPKQDPAQAYAVTETCGTETGEYYLRKEMTRDALERKKGKGPCCGRQRGCCSQHNQESGTKRWRHLNRDHIVVSYTEIQGKGKQVQRAWNMDMLLYSPERKKEMSLEKNRGQIMMGQEGCHEAYGPP